VWFFVGDEHSRRAGPARRADKQYFRVSFQKVCMMIHIQQRNNNAHQKMMVIGNAVAMPSLYHSFNHQSGML
jgi:hypothetical protein